MRREQDDHPTITVDEDVTFDHEGELYSDELAPGTLAGEYVIGGLLATGGCGNVYFGEHRLLRRRAAVKVLHRQLARSPEMVRRFIREARAVNMIRHPSIVDIYDFGELPDRRPYLVMELLQGRSLDALLTRVGRFGPEDALDLLTPVCEALQAAHEAGIVHRDLKASNVIVVKREQGRAVKLVDFGIAKLLEGEPRASASSSQIDVPHKLGTPLNMAPEQFTGDEVSPATDVYALGVLLYQLLTGEYPYDSESAMEIERLHLSSPAPRPSAIAPLSPPLDAVVLRALEKQPAARFDSAMSFLGALRAAVATHRAGRAGSAHCTAVAIHVEARVPLEVGMNDALIEDVAAVLGAAEQAMRSSGMGIPLRTGMSVVGAMRLSPDQAEALRERRQAVSIAVGLHEAFGMREGADPRVHVVLAVHVDSALCRIAPHSVEIIGGRILNVGAWTPQGPCDGVVATEQAAAGVSEPRLALTQLARR